MTFPTSTTSSVLVNSPPSIYNVGTEESYPFNEMVAILNDELGTDVNPKCIACNAPAAETIDGTYVCVECGDTVVGALD